MDSHYNITEPACCGFVNKFCSIYQHWNGSCSGGLLSYLHHIFKIIMNYDCHCSARLLHIVDLWFLWLFYLVLYNNTVLYGIVF